MRDIWRQQCKSQRVLSQWRKQRHIHWLTDGSYMLLGLQQTFYSHTQTLQRFNAFNVLFCFVFLTQLSTIPLVHFKHLNIFPVSTVSQQTAPLIFEIFSFSVFSVVLSPPLSLSGALKAAVTQVLSAAEKWINLLAAFSWYLLRFEWSSQSAAKSGTVLCENSQKEILLKEKSCRSVQSLVWVSRHVCIYCRQIFIFTGDTGKIWPSDLSRHNLKIFPGPLPSSWDTKVSSQHFASHPNAQGIPFIIQKRCKIVYYTRNVKLSKSVWDNLNRWCTVKQMFAEKHGIKDKVSFMRTFQL